MKGIAVPVIRTPFFKGIAVFIIAGLLTYGVAYQSYLISRIEKQKQVLKEINSVNYNLKTAIDNGLSASNTLNLIINRYGIPADFDSIAKSILGFNKYIDALEITKKGVITNIYPLAGNEAAMGFDVLGDSSFRKEAYIAIKKKQLYFAGPLELKQGGIAVVGRLPFFIDNKFEGFSMVIIKLPTLLRAAGISLQNRQFMYQLSKKNPITLKEEFFLPAPVPFDTTHSITVTVPDGKWKLYVMQRENKISYAVVAISILGFIFSLMAGLFTWYMTRQPDKLNKLVAEKTTELMHVKNNIAYSEARLTEAQEVAKIGSWETDLVTLNVIWSKETFRIFEIEDMNFKPSHADFLKFVHPDDRERVGAAFTDSLTSKKSNAIEHKIVTQSGKQKWVEERWRIFYDEKGEAVRAIGTCQDITERIKIKTEIISSYYQLQELTAHLQVIREEERKRIAREIHDELGQQLTALKMDTTWVSKKLIIDDEAIIKRLSNMAGLIDDTVKTIRRISSDLRPGILDDLGLIPALEWQGEEYEKRTGIKLQFHTNINDITLDQNISTNIFRIFQEALTNTIKHSGATETYISVEKNEQNLLLIIKDNGQGFDLNKLRGKHSLGLVGMKERAALLKAELVIDSVYLKGTTITLKVPLH
ncbi:MAG TPA: histidine kinase [Flavobacteriales bacterium]|nr:histidine kinase [Flavobacteriales bacterium]